MVDEIKLALLQISTGSDKEENLEKTISKIRDLEENVDLAIAPEYLMGLKDGDLTKELLKKNYEPLDSWFVESFREEANKSDISLLLTTYRKENGDCFNSSVFVDDDGGILGVYDKIHLFDAFDHKESDFFRYGENITVFEWNSLNIGLATCFDLRFPELFRILKFHGADIVLVPSGFYAGSHKSEQWRTLISSRAHENNLFVVGVNQPKPYFVGESQVSSPLGYEIDKLGEREEVGIVTIAPEEVEESWRKMPMNKLIRSNFYKKYDPYRD